MAASTAQLGNLAITTQVVPASENSVPGLATLPSTQNWAQVLSQKKKQPIKSLSAVNILIGVLQLTVGASMHVAENNYPSLVSRIGVYFGSLVFISSGIITVVFASEENILKIKTGLFSHGINAACAAIEIILYAIQVHTDTQACWVPTDEHSKNNWCTVGNSSTDSPYDHYPYYYRNPQYITTLRVSLNSLVLVYIIVGFIISSCIVLLRWKSLKQARYTLL